MEALNRIIDTTGLWLHKILQEVIPYLTATWLIFAFTALGFKECRANAVEENLLREKWQAACLTHCANYRTVTYNHGNNSTDSRRPTCECTD